MSDDDFSNKFPEDLQAFQNLGPGELRDIAGVTSDVADVILKRAEMIEIEQLLPEVDDEIRVWEEAGRPTEYPEGFGIGQIQEIMGIKSDGKFGPDTIKNLMGRLRSELVREEVGPYAELAYPHPLIIYGNLSDHVKSYDAETYYEHVLQYNRYAQGLANNGAQERLVNAHKLAFGHCSEETVLSLENLFDNQEQFSELIDLAQDTSVEAAGKLNGKIKDIIRLQCGYILDQISRDPEEQDSLLTEVATSVQSKLENIMRKPEPPEGTKPQEPAPPKLPNDVGPNGEQDAMVPSTAPSSLPGVKV